MAPTTPASSQVTRSQSSKNGSAASENGTSSPSSSVGTKSSQVRFKLLDLDNDEFDLTRRLLYQSFKDPREYLKGAEIVYSASTNKDFLPGVAILFDLGIIKKPQAPNEEFAVQTGKWAQLSVVLMRDEVKIQDVISTAPKKDMLKHLIQSMITKGSPHWLYSATEASNAAKRELDQMMNQGKMKAAEKVRQELDIEINYRLNDLSYEVINLLVATVSYHIEKSKGFSTCKGRPRDQYITALNTSKEIPVLESHADITDRLTASPASPVKTILNWIWNAQKLLDKFYGFYEDTGEKSQLVFYGTPLRNLRGITHTGFDRKTVFTTEPRIAIAHAIKDMSHKFREAFTKDREVRPYLKSLYGAVIAGESAHGLMEDGEANVFKELGPGGRVLGRYVVPNTVDTEDIPKGKNIEKALFKGFQQLRDVEWAEEGEKEDEDEDEEDEEEETESEGDDGEGC